jgi:AcrR family transcriptional regulator
MTLPETLTMRQRILQEATCLFTRNGYTAVSIREIAEACGITKAALYYHFKDKEDLIVAILSAYLTEMGSIISACRAAAPTTRERVRIFIETIFAQPIEQRALIRLGSQEMVNLSPETRISFGRLYQESFIGPLAAILAEGIQNGELRLADSHQVVWVLLGMMYPFFYPNPERLGNMQNVIDLIVTTFFDGMTRHD